MGRRYRRKQDTRAGRDSSCACPREEVYNRQYAPIAQLDRAPDFESVGRGFESLWAYFWGIGDSLLNTAVRTLKG